MTVIYTERIWAAPTTDICPREGELCLEDMGMAAGEAYAGPIHVASGLEARDVAAFLSFNTSSSCEWLGFLVTQVRRDGSGILVAGDLFERSPATWVCPRIKGLWDMLAQHGYDPGGDFELPVLADYLARLRIVERCNR